MASRKRTGLTLIELLVVIAVIGLLVALLIPAVMAARGAAIKARCANNLRQIGLAIHQHGQAHGSFPLGTGRPASQSYLVQILPYLEQAPLHGSFNLSIEHGMVSNENMTSMALTPGIYMCPGDSPRPPGMEWAVNYAGNTGLGTEEGEGVFLARPLAERDITDGLSQTAGVAEWLAGAGFIRPGFDPKQPHRLRHQFFLRRRYADTPEDVVAFTRTCWTLDRAEIDTMWMTRPKAYFWISGDLGSSLYNHLMPPNQPSCRAQRDFAAVTAASFHGGGGAHVLTMDGAVHFVRESIDHRIWLAAGSRSGGETLAGLAD